MQFLYPSFLWALLALSIPIIIHLFYFKRFKKVYFTNVKYLKEIKEETSNRNKLKNLLVLLARCLALAALVFAFAQPFVPIGDAIKTGANHVSVFIDNSFSMTAARQDIPLLDFAKDRATSIVHSYGDEDKFQILTHDFEGRHQRFVTKEDALSYISEIKVTPVVQTLGQVLARQKQLFGSVADNKISYIVSDFQQSITNLENYQDTTIEVNLLPIQSAQLKNISVDSAWFDGPIPVINQNNKLVIRVKNNSQEDAEQVKISFKKDGQDKPVAILDIPANGSMTDTISINVDKPGWHEAIVAVNDYPIQFDDQYFLAFEVPDTIQALFINESGANKYMDALFKGVKYFSLFNQNVNQLQYQQFGDFNLIILNDLNSISSGLANELVSYLRGGGKVLVFPGKNATIPTYNSFFTLSGAQGFSNGNRTKREVSSINTEEFVFSNVFIKSTSNLKLPVASFSFNINRNNTTPVENLLLFRDGDSFLSKYKVGDGQLFICTSPLDNESSDLVYNAEIFVPMVYKMAIANTKYQPLAYTVSSNVILETANKRKTGDYIYKIGNDQEEFIPGQIPNGNKINLNLSNQ
ncbi:MAG: BatA domain-containing protein, partial [Saprospiraceae bacterium]